MDIGNIFVTSRQMRLIDKKAIEEYKIPAKTLMENAGRGCSHKIIEILKESGKVLSGLNCVIICGTGNNGGDGLVIARYLDEEKLAPRVFILKPKDKYNELVSSNLKRVSDFKIPFRHFTDTFADFKQSIAKADFIVDALLGTGAKGAPKGYMADIINIVNASKKTVFSVDIPTGLDADTGNAYIPCVKADYTFTLGFNKKGFLNPASKIYTGKVKVIDIGLKK